MTLFDNLRFAASHTLRLTLLLVFFLALPLDFAIAQDFEAVEKRLAKGVVKGELSLGQAAAMIEMLHEIAEENDKGSRNKWMQMKKSECKHGGECKHGSGWKHDKGGHHKHHGDRKHHGHRKHHDDQKHHDGDHEVKSGKKDHHSHRGDHKRMPVDREMVERIRGALEKADFNDDQMRMARGVIMRMAFAMKSAGKDYRMNPQMQSFLTEKAEFNDEQIKLLESIAKRVSMRMLKGGHRGPHGRGEEMRKRFEKMRKKIEAAVESGEMTRKQADAKYREIRERMEHGRHGKQKENSADSGQTPAEPTVASPPAEPTTGEEETTAEPALAETPDGAAENEPAEVEQEEPEATAEA